MLSYHDYFATAKRYLLKAKDQRPAILEAARMLGEMMCTDGIVQLYGANKGTAFVTELYYRAGGLMPYHSLNLQNMVLKGYITEAQYHDKNIWEDASLADVLWNSCPIQQEDLFFIISETGTEQSVIALAKKAKANGHKLVAALNKQAAKQYPNKENLLDFADVALDIETPYPDLNLTTESGKQIGQVFTITGNTIAQMLTAEVYRYLKEKGEKTPVLLSANVVGADVHNREISNPYEGRWND